MANVSIITAKAGDTVELGTKEYDVVDGGATLRMSYSFRGEKAYKRDGVVAAIKEHQNILAELQAILTEMDSKGVHTGPQEL